MQIFRNLLYKAMGALGAGEAKAFERSTIDARGTQWKLLLELLERNAQTQFGKEHGFSSIKSIAEYQKRVPIRDYDAFSSYVNRIATGEKQVLTTEEPLMFATTSGTVGSRKLIPVTESYMKEFRRASITSGFNLLKNYPAVVNGVTLSVASPAEEGKTPAGIPYGAISGRLFLSEPKLIRKYISPIPYEVFLITDYETRYYTLLRCALVLPLATIYTLNPSTVLLLARRLNKYADSLVKDIFDGTLTPPGPLPEFVRPAIRNFLRPDERLAARLQTLLNADQFVPYKIWPTLVLVCCWTKAAAAFYLQDFPQYFGDVPICDITYGASEGRGTVFLAPNKQALAIRSHFFEFVPAEEMGNDKASALIADELEVGQEYNILFTTAGGLYRYNINDIVKVVGYHNTTPLLEFQHKAGNISSFTGEKITESQVTQALSNVSTRLSLPISFFTVVPQFRPQPHYELWLEISDADRSSTIAQAFDQEMCRLNIEYAAKRESLRLEQVKAKVLRLGSYENLRRQLTAAGVPDAQIKISHLNPKSEVKEYLEKELIEEKGKNVLFVSSLNV